MPTVISLLRGINVGGHKRIKMAELRQLYSALGLQAVRSVLQSGNVVFQTQETDLARLKERLEAGIRQSYGFEAQVILRRAADFKAALARQPFDTAQLAETRKIALVFLSGQSEPNALADLRANNPGREVIHSAGSELYIFYRDGMARSKLDNKRIESALGLSATARNWNTCQRLLKLLAEVEAQSS